MSTLAGPTHLGEFASDTVYPMECCIIDLGADFSLEEKAHRRPVLAETYVWIRMWLLGTKSDFDKMQLCFCRVLWD